MTTTATAIKRITALLFALVFCIVLITPAFAVETTTVSPETQEKVDALKQKQKELSFSLLQLLYHRALSAFA